MILVGETRWDAWAVMEFDGDRWHWSVWTARRSTAVEWLSTDERCWREGSARSEATARRRADRVLGRARRFVAREASREATREEIR